MSSYILPVFSLLMSFMALISCIRFIFSKQFAYWILPSIISLILCFQNLNTLLVIATINDSVTKITFSDINPVLLSVLWYAMVIVFYYALKLAIPENKYISDSRKNLSEALYMEKYEERKSHKERINREQTIANRTGKPDVKSYRGPDIG